MHDSVRFHSHFRYVVPLSSMVNPGWCTRLFVFELSSILYRTLFLYLDNDVVSPLLTPHILALHVYLLMMSEAPVLVILICVSSLYSGLEILHQREGVITETECGRIGSSDYSGRCKVVAQIIVAKSMSESLKICEICEQYQLLDRSYDMNRIKGVSVCDLCIKRIIRCIIYSKFVQFSMKW